MIGISKELLLTYTAIVFRRSCLNDYIFTTKTITINIMYKQHRYTIAAISVPSNDIN